MQILIWGDIMKRNIGISIFVLFIIAVGVTVLRDNMDADSMKADTNESTQFVDTEAMIKTNAEADNFNYYIGLKDGAIVVFEKDGKTIYIETDINTSHFSDETIEKLSRKIGYNNLGDVYDFLESYSS